MVVDYVYPALSQRETTCLFLAFAGPDSGAAHAGLSTELRTAETSSQVKRLIGKQNKRSGSLEYSKWVLI